MFSFEGITSRASTLKTEYNQKQKTETIEKNRLKSDREERETQLEIGQAEDGIRDDQR